LCDAGADKDKLSEEELECPLVAAVNMERCEIVRFLCEAAADVNNYTDYERSPLRFVLLHDILHDNWDMVRLLCEARADMEGEFVNALHSETPLVCATRVGNSEGVRILCEALADVNKCTSDGSPMVNAAGGRHSLECLRVLHEAGASIVQDSDDTPLSAAVARRGNVAAVRFLIEVKANLEEAPTLGRRRGETPLQIAAKGGDLEVVKLLCEAGAEKDTRSLSVAADKGHKDVVHYLRDAMLSDVHARGGLSGLLHQTVSRWFAVL